MKFLLSLLLAFSSTVALADGPCYLKSTSTACFKPVEVGSGGTGVVSTATFPTSGVIVTRTSTDTLTNKTLTLPKIDQIIMPGVWNLDLTANTDWAFPTSTRDPETLVGQDNVQTIQNKTIGATNTITGKDTTFTVVDSADPSKIINFNAGGTTGTKSTITGTQTADRVITLPDATTTLVGTNRSIGTTAPVTGGGDLSADRTIAIPRATTAVDGYLSSTDWTTFNSKVGTGVTIGTTAPITGGGDLSTNRTFAITQAATAANGYVSSTDWNTFNSKQATISATAPVTLTGAAVGITQSATAANGYLSSTDWNTFNAKQPLITTLSPANGGTGIANNSASTLTISGNFASTLTVTGITGITLPTTGTLSTLAGAEVITNKDHDGGTASNTSRLTVPKASLATLTALTRKQGTLVYDTTANALLSDDGSNLNAIGGGAGEKNYITAPNTAAGWTASAAGVTVTTATSGIPRLNTTKTGFLVTRSSGSAAFAYNAFVLDDADFNKKLKVQFDMEPNGSYAASDQELDAWSCTQAWSGGTCGGTSARLPLSTDSSALSLLPLLTGTYRTTFDAPGATAKWIQVQFGLHAATASSAVAYSDVVVGPGVVTQGAAVTGWTSYTPTGAWSTNTTYTGFYRRVGDTAQFKIQVATSGAPTAADFSVTFLPSGMTVNTTVLPTIGSAPAVAVGSASLSNNGGTFYPGTVVLASSTLVKIVHAVPGSNIGILGYLNPFTYGAGGYAQLEFTVPINEWAGSGTVNVLSNGSEFSSNSDISDAADTTHFVYGPSGSPTPGTLTAARRKTVRFLSPISVTDALVLEVSNAAGDWIPLNGATASGIQPMVFQGAKTYGVSLDLNAAAGTDLDVIFGQYYYGNSTTTYAAAGADWGSLSAYRWRVRKTAGGGGAIGFSNVTQTGAGLVQSAGQLLGTNTNDSATAGNVGEIISSSSMSASTTTVADTEIDVTGASIALTPGQWIIHFSGTIELKNNTGGVLGLSGRLRLTDSANTGVTGGALFWNNNNNASANHWEVATRDVSVKISANTTYKLRVTSSVSTASGAMVFQGDTDIGVFTGTDNDSYFYAERVR
jgi:hypothetical protein